VIAMSSQDNACTFAHRAFPAGYFFADVVADRSLSVGDAIVARYIVVRIVRLRSGAATSGKPAADTRRPTAGDGCTPIAT
jgi:hypothetical protein